MIYEIRHRVEYEYSLPVYLETHQLHLMPRSDSFQKLQLFSLHIEPEPSCISAILDAAGNSAHEIWFGSRSEKLRVEAVSRVETLRDNPFDYLLEPGAVRLPARYAKDSEVYLAPYRSVVPENTHVAKFAAQIAERAGHETIGFLSELCLAIHGSIRYVRREEGRPLPAEQTLREAKGACRDLAVLFMACCRSQGLAARFTSGYASEMSEPLHRDLHAWVEVYLEGGGWRGFDPSTGLAVCDQHVALASAADSALVTPVSGSFRGSGAKVHLQASVSLQSLAEAAPGPSFL